MKIRYEKADTIQTFWDLPLGAVFQSGGGTYIKTTQKDRFNAWDVEANEFSWFSSDVQVRLVNAELLIK